MDATITKLALLFFGAPLTDGALRRWPYKPREAGPPPADDEFLVKWAAVIFGLLLLSLALVTVGPWLAHVIQCGFTDCPGRCCPLTGVVPTR
jgi:hypothetical protein